MEWLQMPVVQGAVAGFVTAFVQDFREWKSWGDAAFNVKTASFKWVQGAVLGGLTLWGFSATV